MVVSALKFMWYYWKINWQGAMEFRASFLTQIISMMLNNAVWIAFWAIYFTKFPVVNGWELRDILILWGIRLGSCTIWKYTSRGSDNCYWPS